jgi:L-arabinose isomerase
MRVGSSYEKEMVAMGSPKVGLLPFYLALYDQAERGWRGPIERFADTIADQLRARDVRVVSAPVCTVRNEFATAVEAFEQEQVDAIVTLHLAYSPSLESAEILANTRLPIVVLDTTPAHDFGPGQDPAQIRYNHGIHGVQDMCNLLLRNGKPFAIVAGHFEKSDVLDRAVACIGSARVASGLMRARVGRIGRPFAGMGDFLVEEEVLRSTIGMEVVSFNADVAAALRSQVTELDIRSEMVQDLSEFESDGLDPTVHRNCTISNLVVRKWIEQERLTAFTASFLDIGSDIGLTHMPFLEAGKAMSRGIGYAGEGDVLTAGLVGAIARSYPDVSFVEMFCPDWQGNSVFLSHMGEANLRLLAERPTLKVHDFKLGKGEKPLVAYGRFRAGEAVLVDLAPAAGDTYRLVAAPLEVLDLKAAGASGGGDRFGEAIRGWVRPRMAVSDFLEQYSMAGGTHHAALVYGAKVDDLAVVGRLMGWEVTTI